MKKVGSEKVGGEKVESEVESKTEDATMRYADKVAIVTGAASGIGLATARRIGSEGARRHCRFK